MEAGDIVRDNMKVMRRETYIYKMPEWATIRKVTTKEDYAAYGAIYLKAFGNSFLRRLFLRLNVKQIYQGSYVWIYKGEYVGIYTLKDEEEMRVTPDINFQVLYNFAIIPTKQGQGFGKLLLASAITEAAKSGYRELLLSVNVYNSKALNLYTQFGFKFTDMYKQKGDE